MAEPPSELGAFQVRRKSPPSTDTAQEAGGAGVVAATAGVTVAKPTGGHCSDETDRRHGGTAQKPLLGYDAY
jgi:hypothetical protein